MKKVTLLAASAMLAVATSAQYTVDPSTSVVVGQGPKTVEYMVLSEGAIAELTKAGATLAYIGPDSDNGRNLWYWEDTFVPGDESYPRVDMEEGGYISVEVAPNQSWSGAGIACATPGISTMNLNDNTRFHIAYMTPSGNGPASIALIIGDGDLHGSAPAKVALGTSFNDGGAIYPTIGPKISDDWQGVDISFADLKKMYPSFNMVNSTAWLGNIFSWLGGAVAGQTMAFDTIYFYNTDDAGVESVFVDENVFFVVTSNTVNVNGANGIELYNVAGQLVKSTEGAAMGINNLASGVYVAKCGNKTAKVVVR